MSYEFQCCLYRCESELLAAIAESFMTAVGSWEREDVRQAVGGWIHRAHNACGEPPHYDWHAHRARAGRGRAAGEWAVMVLG